MPQQHILAAMHSLVQEGKSITTAAVKARLTTPVPLTDLMALVSRYKQAPHSLPPLAPAAKPAIAQAAEHCVLEQSALALRVTELEATVSQLHTRLAHLEHLLAALSGPAQESAS